MSEFSVFGKAVHNAFNTMLKNDNNKKEKVFVVEVTGDDLWAHYLAAFPEGTNPIFRERTEYDCSCCRNFIKNIGAVVYADGSKLLSVWDVELEDETFKAVAASMSKFVKSLPIARPFIVSEPAYGAETTNIGGETWHHFHAKIPNLFMWKHNASNYVGERTEDMKGLRRSIKEISDDALEQVSDLIDQDSLHKGPEYKWVIDSLRKLKRKYSELPRSKRARELFLWVNSSPKTRFHSTVIGTLLVDLTEGVDLEIAVKKFEDKVSGTNYKRSKALVTQKMIDEAQKLVEKLGLEDSLARRYAVREDISVNDVLFVDGSVKKKLLGGAFDAVKPTKKAVPELKNIEEISIKDFLKNVLPKADTVEVFVKNNHLPNFVSLIAPVHGDAKPLFKWDNAFSWSYDGEVTDSIRERVKKAGGKVDGDIRVSLSWHNADDLDLHMNNGSAEIYYHNRSEFGATLDVDMNGMDKRDDVAPVENIVWPRKENARPGRHEIVVHNYSKRSTANVGFEVEVEVMGQLYSYEHPTDLRSNATVTVGYIVVGRDGKITVEGLKAGSASNEKWGVSTEVWTPVDLITKSPNFWNEKAVGHEHVFFMLKDCKNEDGTRGFYNEYLRDELHEHRKVFEVVSGQLKVPYSKDQLSGIGFSVTKRDEIQVRVKGAINRVLTVKF